MACRLLIGHPASDTHHVPAPVTSTTARLNPALLSAVCCLSLLSPHWGPHHPPARRLIDPASLCCSHVHLQLPVHAVCLDGAATQLSAARLPRQQRDCAAVPAQPLVSLVHQRRGAGSSSSSSAGCGGSNSSGSSSWGRRQVEMSSECISEGGRASCAGELCPCRKHNGCTVASRVCLMWCAVVLCVAT